MAYCPKCGKEADWVNCDKCDGEGGLWILTHEGSEYVLCEQCDGEEGFWQCEDCGVL